MKKQTLLPLLCLCLLLAACSSRGPTRHLSSDVCLLLPEQTTKLDVVRQLGSPDVKHRNGPDETWIYHQVSKNLMGKIPWAGKHIGRQEYEVVTVNFVGNTVRACVFRAMNEEEFRALKLPTDE